MGRNAEKEYRVHGDGTGGNREEFLCRVCSKCFDGAGNQCNDDQFSRILNELTKYHADKNEIIAGLVSYPLLIIDDLGIERNSEFALEMIYNVVDRRYCTRKPLIVTTNLSYQDMTRKDLDIEHQRIYSRLMEMCFPVIYQGKDLRQKERDLKLEWMKLNGD